jgi:hypothetical protein
VHPRLEVDVDIARIEAHHFGRHFRPTHRGDDALNFGKLQQRLLDVFRDGHALRQRCAGQPARLDEQRPFVELRHEFRAEVRDRGQRGR